MSETYTPPYALTGTIVSLIEQIGESLGRISLLGEQALRLRRINRIRTVHGSVAIEGNTLTEEQVTAVMEGKRVLASPREIQEVKNALKAYGQLSQWQSGSEADLLEAHATMTYGLLGSPGSYRKKSAGVMGREGIIHVAPPADLVPFQIKQLLEWLVKADVHPLVASAVFHYEFKFIHPFADGNGRVGRLWQTLILTSWNPLFADIPVESMIHAHQQEYYVAINASTNRADCAPFIEFILQTILETLEISQDTTEVGAEVATEVKRLLAFCQGEQSKVELRQLLGLKNDEHFRKAYIKPALEFGVLEMTIPNKPNSRLQKYRLTPLGCRIKGNRAG